MILNFIFLLSVKFLLASCDDDVPCLSKYVEDTDGYVCVCNETYCDTVGVPTPLSSGQFYQYTTSETVPGFTKTTGTFTDVDDASFYDVSSDVTVQVNASVVYQEFSGMGTAISDNAGIAISNLSSAALDNLVESYFGENGLEMTYVRMPMAGSDFSQRYYTYDDVDGDIELTQWNLTQEDFLYKIPLIKKFQAAYKRDGGIKLYANSWTAPNWMKTNGKEAQGYLKNEYLTTWAKYYVKFLQAYKEEGIDIWGISPGNELVIALYFGSFFSMPNTVMLPNQARLFVKKHLEPALKSAGFEDVKIYGLEDERPFALWWTDRLFKEEGVQELIEGVALHWYLDSNTTITRLEEFHTKYPNQKMIYTESSINSFQTSSGNAVELGSWDSGVRYINNMYQNLCHWVSAYVDWNFALNKDGGPVSTEDMVLDSAIIVNETISEFYKQPIYYILGHFSKFILPGAYRIQALVKQDTEDPWTEECYSTTSAQNFLKREPVAATSSPFPTRTPDAASTSVMVLAASNPDGRRTIVTYNPRNTTVNINVNDLEKGSFKATLEPHSMNTFLYW